MNLSCKFMEQCRLCSVKPQTHSFRNQKKITSSLDQFCKPSYFQKSIGGCTYILSFWVFWKDPPPHIVIKCHIFLFSSKTRVSTTQIYWCRLGAMKITTSTMAMVNQIFGYIDNIRIINTIQSPPFCNLQFYMAVTVKPIIQ